MDCGMAEYVASWDGTAWSRLGEGLGPHSYTWVNALAVYHGRLLAGGEFSGFKSWDGSTWSGAGPGCFTGELDVFNGNLVIAGSNFLVEPSARHIGSWDGTSLSSLGSGTNGSVMALTEYNGNLVVGGSFTIAGGKVSAGLALWSKPCCIGRVGDANVSNEPADEVTLGDIMLLVDAKFISGDCSMLPCVKEADVNQDGGADPNCDDHVTLGDIMMLVDFLFITGPDNAILPECL